jgi:hypothetical protein
MTVYRIRARCAAPPAADWREQLAARLGGRPRRIGRWAELGLYGALQCMDRGGEGALPAHAAVVLSSQHGPAFSMREALGQVREGLPQPLTFLQIQPSQLLATLSAQLHWCGDARFVTQPDPLAVLDLALAMAEGQADGLLLGWVNELDELGSQCESSQWLRLEPVADPGGAWQALRDFEMLQGCVSHVQHSSSGLAVIIAPQSSQCRISVLIEK